MFSLVYIYVRKSRMKPSQKVLFSFEKVRVFVTSNMMSTKTSKSINNFHHNMRNQRTVSSCQIFFQFFSTLKTRFTKTIAAYIIRYGTSPTMDEVDMHYLLAFPRSINFAVRWIKFQVLFALRILVDFNLGCSCYMSTIDSLQWEHPEFFFKLTKI